MELDGYYTTASNTSTTANVDAVAAVLQPGDPGACKIAALGIRHRRSLNDPAAIDKARIRILVKLEALVHHEDGLAQHERADRWHLVELCLAWLVEDARLCGTPGLVREIVESTKMVMMLRATATVTATTNNNNNRMYT